MPDHELTIFKAGVNNFLEDENIPPDAASDESNWITQDGRLKLASGRLRIGTEGSQGHVQGELFGYKIDGTKIHWRKINTAIQYWNGSAWTNVVTGLTSGADYKFANYSSLAGTFTFAFGIDGIFKFHNAFPAVYLSMYDPLKNFKGFAFIDKGRAILWNRPEDKTGLYGSKIDRQDSTVYTTEANQTLASGDGSTQAFSGTLSGAGQINYFGFTAYGPIAAAKNITNVVKGGLTTITAIGHGLSTGDYVVFASIGGTTQLNGTTAKVFGAPDADTLVFNIDSSSYGAYTSGGTVTKIEYFFNDDYLGHVTSNLGGTGTLNYVTGAWTLNFHTAPTNASNNILGSYQFENSNNGGVTDFRKSSPRVAGEGFVIPQDEGGDPILTVLIGPDGSYYSLKSQSSYQLTLDDADTDPTNIVYRRNIGVPSFRAGIATNKGIVFINTANPEKPELTILQRNPISNFVEPLILFPQFKFANYIYDDCNIDTWDRYVIICSKTLGATSNDTILLADLAQGSIDITSFNARTTATDSGNLYIGSSVTQTTYELFNGFDDDGLPIQNFWIGQGSLLRPLIKLRRFIPAALKKVRKLRLRGLIDANQNYSVYIDYDDAGFQLVGTIRGDGAYVDYSQPQVVGAHYVGQAQVGGDVTTTVYPYFTELRLRTPKFRKRTIKIVANGIGYVDIDFMADHAITMFEDRLPKRYRQKQYVSLDGKNTDLPSSNLGPELVTNGDFDGNDDDWVIT
jgi:hypothetical protein